jgi:hypothetical protein
MFSKVRLVVLGMLMLGSLVLASIAFLPASVAQAAPLPLPPSDATGQHQAQGQYGQHPHASSSYTQGFRAGYRDGFSDGYRACNENTGYSARRAAPSTTRSPYDQGYADGYAQGYRDGYSYCSQQSQGGYGQGGYGQGGYGGFEGMPGEQGQGGMGGMDQGASGFPNG